MTDLDHIVYGLLWLSFGAGHSVLASERAKAFTRRIFETRERLAYNFIAVVHVAIVWAIGMTVLNGANTPSFDLAMPTRVAFWTLVILGAGLILVAYRHYDGDRFTGLRGTGADAPAEPLHTSGLHRYVRHPLYAGAFLILIGQATDPFGLATCLWASLYLLIGTWFEERRLIDLYGDAYRTYRSRVPAYVPWKGRALD